VVDERIGRAPSGHERPISHKKSSSPTQRQGKGRDCRGHAYPGSHPGKVCGTVPSLELLLNSELDSMLALRGADTFNDFDGLGTTAPNVDRRFLMIIFSSQCPAQLDIVALLNARATQPRIQHSPDRRFGAAFLRRYIVEAFSEGMRCGHPGPWRVGWQRHAWSVEDPPRWASQVVCGRYRLNVHTVSEAIQVRAMLNWFRVPQPAAADRRGDQRGRRQRFDRRGREGREDGWMFIAPQSPHTLPGVRAGRTS